MDEFIYPEGDFGQFLKDFNDSTATIIKPTGYDMIVKDFDFNQKGQIIDLVKTGYENDLFNKLLVFKPKEIKSINYNFGCHVASPTGNVKYYENDVKLLHYKRLGLEYYLLKNKNYKKRLSEFNKKNALGYEYAFDTNKHIESFNESLSKSKIVI
jgi:hypothetical protein